MIDKPATYWHMLPAYSQGRKAIWSAVNPHTGKRRIDEAFPHELRANTNESEMFIRLKNGSTWQVVGSDRYDAAVGSSAPTRSSPTPRTNCTPAYCAP
jgi:phage terminase large subunit